MTRICFEWNWNQSDNRANNEVLMYELLSRQPSVLEGDGVPIVAIIREVTEIIVQETV